MMNDLEFVTVSMNDLSMVSGGVDGPQAPQPPANDYPATQGNPVQQGAQMVDNAATGYRAARQAGCSWYESLGNATIAAFGLRGGFGPNGQPR